MARTLEELQKQYNSSSKKESPSGMPPMPGPGRGRGPGRASGKPKDMKKTVGRLLSYVGKYKLRLIFVFIFMITC